VAKDEGLRILVMV